MVNAANIREYQGVMHCRLIIEEFGPNINHIYEVYNMAADTLSSIQPAINYWYEPMTTNDQCCANDLLATSAGQSHVNGLTLYILLVKTEQQKHPRNLYSKLSPSMQDHIYGYYKKALDDIKTVFMMAKYMYLKPYNNECYIVIIYI